MRGKNRNLTSRFLDWSKKLFAKVNSFFVSHKNLFFRYETIIVTILIIISIILIMFPRDNLKAQNYNKIWTSTDDFNTGSNSNVDTSGGQVKLTTATTNFNEDFSNSTYKDATTNANWDTSTKKLTLPGDASGTYASLETKWTAAVGSSENIQSLICDSANNFIYIGGLSGSFVAYNIATDTAINLTSKISTNWSTTAIYSMTFDSVNNIIYIAGDSGKFGAFAGGSDPANGTWTYLTSKISADWSTSYIGTMIFDSTNGVIYLAGAFGRFGAFAGSSNPANGTWTYLTSKISADWVSTVINSLTFDSTNNLIYIGGNEGKFGAFAGGSNPANGTWTYLKTKISADWATNSVYALAYDSINNKIYLGGQSGFFGAFVGGSDPANGTWTNLISKIESDFSTHIYFMSFNSSDGRVYLCGPSGSFGAFAGGSDPANGTWTYLSSSIVSDWSTIAVNTLAFDPIDKKIYIAGDSGKFGSFVVGYTSDKNGISSKLNSTAQNIYKATLTATASVPTNTAITYYLSNDGGSSWHEVTSGTEYSFASGGSDLRWKANLTTSNASITPEITAIAVSYKFFSSNTGTMDLIYDATQAVVPTKLYWNHTLPSNTTLTFKVRTASTSNGLSSATWSDIKNASDTPVDLKTINVGGSAGVLENRFSEIYITFGTTDGLNTPVLSDITEEYVINASPELQNLTVSQTTDGSKIVNIGYQLKDSDTHNNPYNQDKVAVSYQYSVDNGSSWHDCSTVTNTGLQAVNSDNTWKTFTSTWNAGTDLADKYYLNSVKIKVLANDNEQAHNTAELVSSSFTLDTHNPVAGSITGGGIGVQINSAAAWSNSSTVNLALLASDDTTKYMEIRNDSNFAGTKEAYSTTKTNWSLTTGDGNKTVYVRFYDDFGNYTDVSANILVDTTAPDLPLHFNVFDTSNRDDGLYSATTVWDVINDPGDFSQYILERSTDGSTFSELATFSNISSDVYSDKGLSDGVTYYYRLRAKDTHSNYSSYTATLSVIPAGSDVVAPDITGPGPTSSAADIKATITWITSEPASSFVEFGTTTSYGSMQGTPDFVSNHSVTLVGLNPTTTYHYRVRSADGAKNEVLSADYTFTTTLPQEAATGVSITGSTAQKPGADPEEVTIIWTTDKYATSQVFYGTSENNLDLSTVEDTTLNKTHFVSIIHLNPNTKYWYKAYSKDTYNNVVWGELKYFVTAQSGLATPTITTVKATDTTLSSTIISWQTTTVATSVVEIGTTAGVYDKHIEDESLGSTTQHVIRISDLAQGTEYHFRVLGQGVDGFWIASDDYLFSTVPMPAISDVSVKDIASETATISWKTNIDITSNVLYGTASFDQSQGDTTAGKDHAVTLKGLNPATQYQFQIKAVDNYGNIATSAIGSFSTIIDTTAPIIKDMKSEVSIITDTNGDSKAQTIISWSTDEPATSLVNYSMGVAAGDYALSSQENLSLTTSHVVIIANLQPSSTYHMRLVSKDSSNNLATSDDYTVLTLNQEKSLLQYILQILEDRFSWVSALGLF